MPEITLNGLGSPLARVDKQSSDTLNVSINLSSTLDPMEVVTGISKVSFIKPVIKYRSRKGKFLEVTLPSLDMPEGTSTFIDSKLVVEYTTSFENLRSAAIIIRNYR